MTERKRDIYRAIMIAAANGRGLHLTAAECFELSLDDSVSMRAANSISEDEFAYFEHHGSWQFWRDAKPPVQSKPANLASYHRDDPDCPR